jgi:hypothetical protein
LKQTLRSSILLFFACGALAALSISAQAQKIDIGFGVSTTLAPGANSNGPSLTGGAFPGVSGDVLFFHNLGVGAEVFWRAAQGENFQDTGYNYRPVFYDFNAVYAPKLASHTYLELVGGIGALDTHILACNIGIGTCGGTTQIGSSNHFDVDLGGGIKFYVKGGFFVRPEARFYFVNNGNNDYSSNYTTRVGASIGYTFR